MAKIIGSPILVVVNGSGNDSVDNFSTLPPPVANLTAEAGDATVTLSFEAVPDEYQQYLSDETAYIVVLKQGSIPESPTDGYVVKLNKDGLVVNEGGTINPETTPVSSLTVGTSVYLKVNNSLVEFIIINQGIPSDSDLYDTSCNGTWLMMKDIYTTNIWDSSDNKLAESDIHTYLNNTFYNLLDSVAQSAIKEVKIPYQSYYTSNTAANVMMTGSNGLSAKVFSLSGYEVGWTQSNNKAFPIDGAVVEYFANCSAVDTKRIAYMNNTANNWWLRSMVCDGSSYAWSVHTTGDYQNLRVGTTTVVVGSTTVGVRPVIVLNSSAKIIKELNSDIYTLVGGGQ